MAGRPGHPPRTARARTVWAGVLLGDQRYRPRALCTRGVCRQCIDREHDHDGDAPNTGGIERWLRLTDGLGLDREYVMSTEGLLPITRFAVDAYVDIVRDRSILEGIASCLTELFSPTIIAERVGGMLANYGFPRLFHAAAGSGADGC